MNCLKCGRETEEGQVFCEVCRENMKDYPVKSGTPVRLPRRAYEPEPAKKTRWHPAPTMEEQVQKLRKQNRVLTAALCVVLLFLLVAGAISTRYLLDKTPFRPGQNYSSFGPETPPAPPVGNP